MLHGVRLVRLVAVNKIRNRAEMIRCSYFSGVVCEVECETVTLKSEPEVKRVSLSGLFENKRFLVPTFQREYSWTKKNVESLLDDIGSLVDKLIAREGEGGDEGESEFYYLGQIVVTKDVDHEDRKKRAFIVDGQQRLVTLQLIFIYLWRRLEQIGDTYWAQFRDMVLTLPENDRGQSTEELLMRAPMRVLLSQDSDKLLHQLVSTGLVPSERNAKTLSEKNIIKAYEFIVKTLSEKDEQYIKKLRLALQSRVSVSQLEIGSLGEALEIFEVMNTRGLDLSDSDLMKNFLFSQEKDPEFKAISKVWKKISRDVFKLKPIRFASLNFLLRAELIARTGVKISNSDLLEGWKTYLNGKPKSTPPVPPVQKPKDFVNDLETVSEAYGNFTKLMKDSETAFISGKGLEFFKSAQHVPILMAGRKLKNIEVLMELVESRVLLSLYASEGPQNFEKIVPGWAKSIYDLAESNPNASADVIKNRSTAAFAGEDELWASFELKFSELQYGKDTRKIRFALARVLAKLEQECYEKVDFWDYIDGDFYHLDHTEPQEPDHEERRKKFKFGSVDLIESVGNLVILKGPDNASAGNKPPREKIGHYLASNRVMAMMLCPKERWNIPRENRRIKVERIQDQFNFSLENWTKETIWKRTYFCMTYFASTFTHFSPPPFVVPELPDASNEGQQNNLN